ncbi:hypothetical protein A3F37_04105 [Candidatus Saccharibacteria bacterium RIFCSPHIGHO2_12_FULL_41_12]|nr:MAG: hypothetical protein A3F37_04105 [Candidatus Saccharibacteria bacterium RIFCSPHIGHO2_12_FULL_41_12]
MRATNTFFHDRIVLFFLTINTFLFVVYEIFLTLNYDPDASYFIQYRAGASVDEYKSGDATDIIFFAVFAALVYALQFLLSKKIYKDQKHAAWAIMSSSTLVLTLTILATWALFKLR